MRRYTLHPNKKLPPAKDVHGQPLKLFKANAENNTSKAIDQLSGICAGILADGVVCDAEAKFFYDWVQKFSIYEPVWPFTEILQRLKVIFEDGRIDAEERNELAETMRQITGHGIYSDPSETFSSELPIDNPLPDEVVFSGNEFVPTGRFAFGTRQKVFDAISSLNGIPKDGFPTQSTRYLVIGVFASRDWYHTNYGRKIERAVELREHGHPISILSEEHWRAFLQ
jgi:hypothetical protein